MKPFHIKVLILDAFHMEGLILDVLIGPAY